MVFTKLYRRGRKLIIHCQGFFIGRLLDLEDALRDLPLYSCFEASMAAVG